MFGEHYTSAELEMIARCFDTHRYQPLGVFLVRLGIPFLAVLEAWTSADDRHENRSIAPVPVGPTELARLLLGNWKWEGQQANLFSNHQQIGVLLTACKLFGTSEMRHALTKR